MINLDELKQLVAFAELGTLSRVADEFHISTPSITRSMQHLEETFGVTLFVRGKNRIELNKTGEAAVEAAQKLLQYAETTIRQVQDFDSRQHTIIIKSCAPAPLWELQRELNTKRPGMMISSSICKSEEVLLAWRDNLCDMAVLPFPVAGATPFMKENLFVCVPTEHELAKRQALTFAEINGFNFLLRTELGFWDTMCRGQMPLSKFLVQSDAAVFEELVKASTLPCFTTDYGQLQSYPNRVNIPLVDEEAHVTFYLAKK